MALQNQLKKVLIKEAEELAAKLKEAGADVEIA